MQTAKEKQRTKEPVKIWLYELINLAYEMKIYLMSLQVKLFLKLNPVLSSEVRKLKPTCYNSLMMSPRSVKEMTVRLQDIVMDKGNFDLKENLGFLLNKNQIHVIGMGGDGNTIINHFNY